jgi:hypothetical protein
VYALGVLLYELLTGRLPYVFDDRTLGGALRVVAEAEPIPLRAIQPTLAAELETIAAKALQKERAARYGSARELADDLRRHLRDEPIAARPPGRVYRLRKLVRRNRALSLGLALTFLSLLAGFLATAWQARAARAATRTAEQEARSVDAVNEFLVDLLGSDDPGGRPLGYTVVEALEDA